MRTEINITVDWWQDVDDATPDRVPPHAQPQLKAYGVATAYTSMLSGAVSGPLVGEHEGKKYRGWWTAKEDFKADRRLFLVIWGSGYDTASTGALERKECPVEYFQEDSGFGKKDIETVQELVVGERTRLDDLHECWVTRIRYCGETLK